MTEDAKGEEMLGSVLCPHSAERSRKRWIKKTEKSVNFVMFCIYFYIGRLISRLV